MVFKKQIMVIENVIYGGWKYINWLWKYLKWYPKTFLNGNKKHKTVSKNTINGYKNI